VKNKEILVGIFAAVAIVTLYFGIKFMKGSDFFSTSSKYYILYNNVNSLAVSNPVQVNGFSVGRVSDIKILPTKNHTVLVEIDVDSNIKISKSTKAILTSVILEGKSIILALGNDTTMLIPGDTLQSEVAKGMLDMVQETTKPVANDVQTSLAKFNVAIDEMTVVAKRLDSIFKDLQKTPDILNGTLRNVNGKINALSGSFNEVATNLNTTLIELRPTLKNFNTLSDSLKRIQLNKTMLKTQQTLTSLNETLGHLKKGNNTMGKLFTEDTLYVNLNRLLLRTDSLIHHLNENPKHFLGPLAKSRKKVQRDLKKQEEEKKKAKAAVAANNE